MEFLLGKVMLFGGLPLILMAIGFVIGRYVKPWLHAKPSRLNWAREMIIVARGATSELVKMFPDAEWDDIVKKIVDKVIESMDISPEQSPNKVAAIKTQVIHHLCVDHKIV